MSVREKLASEAKVKRSASAPKAGMPFGIVALDVLLRLFLVLRQQQPGGRFLHQRIEIDAVDQVERVEGVALRLRHLLALGVAHDGVDVDVAERHLAGEMQARHDHAGDPEEDDVEAGDQHRGGQEGLQVLASSPASRARRTAPAARRTRCRARRRRASAGLAVRFLDGFLFGSARRRSFPPRRTRPESGGPTTAGARCTSPGCSPASGCRSRSSARGRTSRRRSATASRPGFAMPSIFTNHWSVSIGSTITPVRPERGTRSLYGFSETSRFCSCRSARTFLRAANRSRPS